MSLLGQYEYVINKNHPRANEDGIVYKHVIVAEEMLGRFLFPEEVVHHKDLDKLNNEPNNIMVFATKGDHTRFHMRGCDESTIYMNENGSYVCQEIKYTCIDCGADVTKYAVRCNSCSRIHKRKTKRPSKDELFNLILLNNGNFSRVGELFEMTDNAIRRWCDDYGLPRRSKYYKKYTR